MPGIESLLLILANILLFVSQYVKFGQLATGKLYFLKPTKFNQENMECSICLINFSKGETILELPCFSNHIFHYNCMIKWLK